MTATNKSKWYDNKALLIILLFVFPPLGIVGIFKRNSVAWKKIVYTIVGATMSLFLFLITIALLFPIDYYKEGDGYFYKGQYDKAVESYNKVAKDDTHYTDAQSQLNRIRQISDSLAIQTQIELEAIELEKQKQSKVLELKKQKQQETLISLQKHWADSIAHLWKGFIINTKLNLPDSILFELSGEATKSFNSNKKQTLPTIISLYKKSMSAKGYNYNSENSISKCE